jgi:hypothetical protein
MARMAVWVALAMTLAVTGCKIDNLATRACRGESTAPPIPALAKWGSVSACDDCCRTHDSLQNHSGEGCVCR